MPSQDYSIIMARYNLWQNESLIQAASGLSAAERQADRGAFFGSIERTFSHILWGDQMWLSRFEGKEAPPVNMAASVALITSWDTFKADRAALDHRILDWAHRVSPQWFDGDLTWHSTSIGQNLTRPKNVLVVQMFNHQTHHRGQIHAMLTAAGAKPDATDVPFVPARILQM